MSRMLFFCANRFGVNSVVPGAEALPGLSAIDGTLFVRVAGVLLDALGWVACGEKDQFWDLSGIGWNEAWGNEESELMLQGKNARTNNLI